MDGSGTPSRASEPRAGGIAVQLFRLFPSRAFHHLRKTPVIGDVMLRAIDALLPHYGFVLKRIRAGPLRGAVLELDPRALDMVIGRYETGVQEIVQDTLQQGDTAFDVGAHLGYFTLIMASTVGSQGRVFSFEPDPAIMGALQRNVERNASSFPGRVVPVEAAVAGKAGRAVFARGWRTTRGKITKEEGDFDVEAFTLSDAAQRFGRPALMKIDVEGAELDVLEGGLDLLKAAKPVLLIEAHSSRLEQDCKTLLETLGYRCTSIVAPDRRETYIFARQDGRPT
jgi:FkbM family methyltransferase